MVHVCEAAAWMRGRGEEDCEMVKIGERPVMSGRWRRVERRRDSIVVDLVKE